jgi:hypothetical protein
LKVGHGEVWYPVFEIDINFCIGSVAPAAGVEPHTRTFCKMQDSMASFEPAIALKKPSCMNLNEMLDFLQGSIYFVQKLTASNVLSDQNVTPRRATCQLVR